MENVFCSLKAININEKASMCEIKEQLKKKGGNTMGASLCVKIREPQIIPQPP